METKTHSDGHSGSPSGESPVAAIRKYRRFFQFTVRQMLLLFVLVTILFSLAAPRIRWSFHVWRIQEASRKREAAENDLRTALRMNNVALARQSLEAGADPNLIPTTRPWSPTAPINGLSSLRTCIANGQIEMMELLLEFGADIERIERIAGASSSPILSGPPLFASLGCDQPAEVRAKMVRLLVGRGANPRRLSTAGWSAMDMAFEVSDAQMGDLLREYGLPYGPREMAAFNRLDALKAAVQEKPELLQRRFHSAYAGLGPTLLGIALRRGYREMSLFLIESGAPLDVVEGIGFTMLHEAARGGDPQLIRLLAQRGLDVNATDDWSDTTLCDIAWNGKPEAVAALVELGADVNWQGVNGRAPLHHAVQNDRLDVVRMLLAAGAAPSLPDSKGETPLDLAQSRNPEMAKLLEQAASTKRTAVHD
ncbi:MAG TPA: ankyrin repeat domain-containing protein [Pirellulales bacterium]|nr:ankyrin repeat domain-containing protein [Pirellulales bacterium]